MIGRERGRKLKMSKWEGKIIESDREQKEGGGDKDI